MKRIIFVGMHNKPGKMPLCSSTKSGKLIDKIIKQIPKDIIVIKTNLYDLDCIPRPENKFIFSREWHYRIEPTTKDIIILLGKEVQQNFIDTGILNIIKATHPAYIRSHIEKTAYVEKIIKWIEIINKINP